MNREFTKRKFLTFPLTQQHKKCAELLRKLYEARLSNQSVDALMRHYHEIQEWMRGVCLPDSSLKTIADRYHFHLKLAHMKLKEHNLLPHIRQGDKEAAAPVRPIAIYLDRLRSAHNVGSMIRTTEAFSLGTLYFSEDTPFTDCKQVHDAAMGAEQWVSCKQMGELVSLDDLPRPFILMETGAEATSIFDFIFPETFTLVMGNEEYGCSEVLLKQADYMVEIPLRGRKNSLNVANAFAIAAAEIERQQGKL